jgi:hypothetical protein
MARSRFLKNQAAYADTLRHHAVTLIEGLKKEYDLKDE